VTKKIIRFVKTLQHIKVNENLSVNKRLSVIIHFYVAVLCLVSFVETTILGHYPQARILWFIGFVYSIIAVIMVSYEYYDDLITHLTPAIYTLMVPLGIYLSGSVLTPAVIYTFLVVMLVSVLSHGKLRLIYLSIIVGTIVVFSYFELNNLQATTSIVLDKSVFIDWILFFTTISIVMIRIITNVTSTLASYDSEIKNIHTDLYDKSITDELTELYNKRHFYYYMKNELNRIRNKDGALGILILDIDFFKRYNDLYGHIEGDKCLKLVAQVIKNSLFRKTDLAFRIGGEEFAVIIHDITTSDLELIAQRIHQELALKQIEHSHSTVAQYVTISIGAVMFDYQQGLQIEDMVKIADNAMYQAKHQGRNCTVDLDCTQTEILNLYQG